MPENAKSAKNAYFATNTRYLDNLDAELRKRNIRPVDRALFIEGLRKGGLSVPDSM